MDNLFSVISYENTVFVSNIYLVYDGIPYFDSITVTIIFVKKVSVQIINLNDLGSKVLIDHNVIRNDPVTSFDEEKSRGDRREEPVRNVSNLYNVNIIILSVVDNISNRIKNVSYRLYVIGLVSFGWGTLIDDIIC